MKIEDEACLARGFVRPSWVDIPTGRRVTFEQRHNKLSYMSAEAMAAAFGGDPSYIPSRIGFIYGDQAVMPTESVITRSQSWNELLEELSSSEASTNVDIQVVGFSYSPTLGGDGEDPGSSSSGSSSSSSSDSGSSSSGSSSSSSSDSGDDSSGDYNHILSTGSNAITFHAVSNSQDDGKRGKGTFVSGRYIYQAVLLGYHNSKYYVISRVSLKEGNIYLQKPSGFEIALDWTVVFK